MKKDTKFKKGVTPWNKGMKGFLAGEKHYGFGKNRSEETKIKISENRKGKGTNERQHLWKGNKAGYTAIHTWLRGRLGTARHCSFNSDHKSTRYHWANISGSYLRDIDDWASLCPKCHKTYDKIIPKPIKNIFLYDGKYRYTERRVISD